MIQPSYRLHFYPL